MSVGERQDRNRSTASHPAVRRRGSRRDWLNLAGNPREEGDAQGHDRRADVSVVAFAGFQRFTKISALPASVWAISPSPAGAATGSLAALPAMSRRSLVNASNSVTKSLCSSSDLSFN